MTDKGYVRAKKWNSLYFRLIFNIIIGVGAAVLTYVFLRLVSSYYINTRYLSDQARGERLEAHISDLQNFADKNNISSEDTDKIAYWARQNPYVYLLVYKNDVLFFYSDMENDAEKAEDEDGDVPSDGADAEAGENPEDTEADDEAAEGEDREEDESGDESKEENKSDKNNNTGNKNDYDGLGNLGLGTSKVDRETLIKQAEASGMHPIELSDGTIFAEIADFSEQLYFDVTNLVSLIAAIVALAVVLIIYFRRIISRIKRLESDVNIVSHINMNHSISCNGRDEISMLSKNVENMRNTILDNLEKERAARNANTELVTAMSHDIRTPLTVLLGYIDMLKGYEGCDETVKSYIGATERTAMRLKELSDDMFKYSLAYGSTDQEISMESYDAQMLLEQLFYEHILLLTDSGYTVNFDRNVELEPGETVYTDPQNLMRVVDNVFQNIYKYASMSEPVTFQTVKEKGRVSFIIRNRINDEHGRAESNGIGLKTCKRLAKYIAEDFAYENDGEYFTVFLSLRLDKPEKQKAKDN